MKKHGLTLIEVVISTLLTGVVVVAALNTLGAATKSSLEESHRGQATALAAELMNEIFELPYQDPDGSAVFGPETNEDAANKTTFDDVDDYERWSEDPVQNKDGSDRTNRSAWSRSVDIAHVSPTDVNLILADTDDQGVLRIVVKVYHNGILAEKLGAGSYSSWPPASE